MPVSSERAPGESESSYLSFVEKVGKHDSAERLRDHDRKAFQAGKAQFLHEYVNESSNGKVTLSVCKWPGDLDGDRRTFGISFVMGEERRLTDQPFWMPATHSCRNAFAPLLYSLHHRSAFSVRA